MEPELNTYLAARAVRIAANQSFLAALGIIEDNKRMQNQANETRRATAAKRKASALLKQQNLLKRAHVGGHPQGNPSPLRRSSRQTDTPVKFSSLDYDPIENWDCATSSGGMRREFSGPETASRKRGARRLIPTLSKQIRKKVAKQPFDFKEMLVYLSEGGAGEVSYSNRRMVLTRVNTLMQGEGIGRPGKDEHYFMKGKPVTFAFDLPVLKEAGIEWLRTISGGSRDTGNGC